MSKSPIVPDEIKKAIKEYYNLSHNLECECDPYYGFTCGIHAHRSLSERAKELLEKMEKEANGE
jgi:hypothetical protein